MAEPRRWASGSDSSEPNSSEQPTKGNGREKSATEASQNFTRLQMARESFYAQLPSEQLQTPPKRAAEYRGGWEAIESPPRLYGTAKKSMRCQEEQPR